MAMRILVVDDDPMILELLFEALPSLGFPDVTGASSAMEAQQIIQNARTPFDCCLLDIQMPEITGIELCGWIRSRPGYGQTPILMITAMAQRNFVNQAFAAGATDYVTKPFDPLELSTRMSLAQRLNQERQRVELNQPAGAAPLAVQKPELHAPFHIADVKGVIDLLAMENYLLQLGRGEMFTSSVFAFQIAGIQRLYNSCSAEEYFYTVTDIAEAISENLAYYEAFVAHAGGGAFVCVSHTPTLPEEEELTAHIRETIEVLELCYDDGRPMLVDLKSGPRTRLGLRSARSAVSTLRSAVEQANKHQPQTTRPILQTLRPTSKFRALLRSLPWAS